MSPQCYPNSIWIDIENLCNPGVGSHWRTFQPRARCSTCCFVTSDVTYHWSNCLKTILIRHSLRGGQLRSKDQTSSMLCSGLSSVPALSFPRALKMSKGQPYICGVPENLTKIPILPGYRDKCRHGRLSETKESQYTSWCSCGHYGKAIRWICCQYLGSMVEWSCCSSFGPQLSRVWACPRSYWFGLIHFHCLSSFRVPSIILDLLWFW